MSQVALDNKYWGKGFGGPRGLANRNLLEWSDVSLRRLQQLGGCDRGTGGQWSGGRWTVGN